jgi:hypothetical protein
VLAKRQSLTRLQVHQQKRVVGAAEGLLSESERKEGASSALSWYWSAHSFSSQPWRLAMKALLRIRLDHKRMQAWCHPKQAPTRHQTASGRPG